MNITKLDHACLVIEQAGQELIVDPGMYSVQAPKVSNPVAITLSHVHDDHSYRPHLEQLLEKHPELMLFGTSEVAEKLENLPVTIVHHGDRHEVGEFTLDFYGYLHQEIHRSIPLVENFGLMVNSDLYYPGDSYTIPEQKVKFLACPTSAPWLKISDVMDFLNQIRPQKCFATHNALLSNHGHALQNSRVQEVVEKLGGEFRFLDIGDTWQL